LLATPSQKKPLLRYGGARLPLIILLFLLVAVGVALALRRPTLAKPTPLGKFKGLPTAVRYHNGAWYWIAQIDSKKSVFLRVASNNRKEIASAEAINSYHIVEGRLVWLEKSGKEWIIRTADEQGGGRSDLYKSKTEMMGLGTSEKSLLWLQRSAPILPFDNPYPTLSPQLDLMEMSLAGGAPKRIARLPESGVGTVVGKSDGAIYVTTYRNLRPSNGCVYRIPLDSLKPTRVVSVRGEPYAIFARDGMLYWTANSADISPPAGGTSVRRLDNQGKVETMNDFLPFLGKVYDTPQGVLFVDSAVPPTLWRMPSPDEFPTPVPVPEGYSGLALSDNHLLYITRTSTSINPELAEGLLP
jgi:hypothetical protein